MIEEEKRDGMKIELTGYFFVTILNIQLSKFPHTSLAFFQLSLVV